MTVSAAALCHCTPAAAEISTPWVAQLPGLLDPVSGVRLPCILPSSVLRILEEFAHAKPRHRHDHAGSGIHSGAERIHQLRGRGALLDVERDPIYHAHAAGVRGRIFWRAEAGGGRGNVVHDGVPCRRRAWGTGFCYEGSRAYSAGRGGSGPRVYDPPPRVSLRYAADPAGRRLPAIVGGRRVRRRRISAAESERARHRLAVTFGRSDLERTAAWGKLACASGACGGIPFECFVP